MISQIKLTNIEKHKDLTLNLEAINVIYGSTESGKTSVFRGLQWGLFNDGTTDTLCNNTVKPKKCAISVTAEGHTIAREWSPSDNVYALDTKEYRSFRNGVPTPISTLLNLTPVSVQSRRDMPFMVYYTASTNAEFFSNMFEVGEIQTTIKNVNTAVKDKEKIAEQATATVMTCLSAARKLVLVPQMKKDLDALTALSTAHASLNTAYGRINSLSLSVTAHSEIVANLSWVNRASADFVQVEALSCKLVQNTSSLNKFIDYKEKLKSLVATVNREKPAIAALQELATIAACGAELQSKKAVITKLVTSTAALNANETEIAILKYVFDADVVFALLERAVTDINATKRTIANLNAKKATVTSLSSKITSYTGHMEALKVLASIDDCGKGLTRLKTLVEQYKYDLRELNTKEALVLQANSELTLAKTAYSNLAGQICPTCGNTIGNCNEANSAR